ncbi:MAG: hypothetical protein ACRES2_09095 [Steroidobacteraceae bacterium]
MNAELGKRRRRWPYVLLVIVLGFVGYTWAALSWSYADGERVGILQKFSRKGWICKTYEGELALYVISGVTPQIWYYTVRDATVAARMNGSLGQRVRLHYTEHRGIPSGCFGDTGYFVDSVQPVDAPMAMPVSPGPAVTTQ